MGTTTVVDAARAALGQSGAFMPVTVDAAPTADMLRDAAQRLERVGYRAAWTNEIIGKDAFVQLSVQLAATSRMVFGTGITNVWTRAPQTAHAAAALLAQSYPDRFVLGLGVGYPDQARMVGRELGSSMATLRDYLAAMATPGQVPAADARYPLVVAANGPKMAALGAELADGAMPAMMPPEFTARVREVVGPDKLVIVGLAVVGDREQARQITRSRLTRPGSTYAASVARLGYSEQDIADVSDRLVDALAGHGGPDEVAANVRDHIAAGADHVMVMPSGVGYEEGIARLEELAPALT